MARGSPACCLCLISAVFSRVFCNISWLVFCLLRDISLLAIAFIFTSIAISPGSEEFRRGGVCCCNCKVHSIKKSIVHWFIAGGEANTITVGKPGFIIFCNDYGCFLMEQVSSMNVSILFLPRKIPLRILSPIFRAGKIRIPSDHVLRGWANTSITSRSISLLLWIISSSIL